MPVIRIPQDHWDAVWWELVSSGPISRLSQEPIYAISEKQLQLLRKKKLPYDLVAPPANGFQANNNHAS